MSKTLIIYRMGSLGDTVVALPCFHRILELFPDHHRVVLTNFPISSKAAPIQEILKTGGFTHDAIEYPLGTRDPRRLLVLAKELRSLRPDALIYVGGGKRLGLRAVYRDLAFFRLAGIRRVIGAPLTRDLDAGRIDEKTGHMEPEAERLARCLQKLGPIDLSNKKAWDLRLTPDEIARGEAVLGEFVNVPFIAVNTGGKVAINDWGMSNWTTLLSQLSQAISAPLVFVGGAEDDDRAKVLAASWQHPVLSACGRLSPRESAALLRRASLFVGHDSGPMHLAAANGVSCVCVFSRNNPPGKWYPYSPRGTSHRVFRDEVDVRHIRPEKLRESVLELWRSLVRRDVRSLA
jgi:heptosyltransferase III